MPNKIRTLVSMATDNSLNVILVLNLVIALEFSFFDWIFFDLAGKISDEFEIRTAVVAAFERLTNPHRLIMGEMMLALYCIHF